jgi:uncharacterized protein YjdB
LTLDNVTIAKGDSSKLIPKVLPVDATYQRNEDFTWTTDEGTIVTVNASGEIKGVTAGTAKVTAVAKDGSGLIATSVVSVIQPGLNITGPNVVNVNQSINLLSVLVKTPDETIKSIQWFSPNNNVAKFTSSNTDTGVLQGVAPGQVTITLTITTDKRTYTQTYTVTVNANITSLELNGESQLEVGDTSTLKANYLPGYATSPLFEWSSTNTDVIEITNTGVNSSLLEGYATIKAKAEGEATVKVRALDGSNLTDEIHIQVTQPAIAINSPITLHVGDVPSQLIVSTNFLHDDFEPAVWERDDTSESIVRFSGNQQLQRNIEGKAVGTVKGKVTVNYHGNAYTKDFTIEVDNPVQSVTIVKKNEPGESNPDSVISIDKGESVDLRAIVQRPDAVHSGFQWFILQETGSATLNNTNTQDVTLTGAVKGTIKVRVLVGGKDDTRDIKINQSLTRIDLPEGPIRLVLNTNKNTYDLWSETTVLPVKWREELKDRLEWIYDNNVVTINNGVVTGSKVGDITVTLRYIDDHSVVDTVRVIVQKQYDNRY